MGIHCQTQNADTAAFQMPFPSTGDRQRFEKGESITCRHSHTRKHSSSFKRGKNPTRKQEKMGGEGDGKQERRRNKCKDVFGVFSCPSITQQTVSLELLEMLDTNNALL